MPTNPKDNKGGDLAEIRDLAGRQPKGTVTRRKLFAEQKTGTLEKFRAQQARKDVGKTRTVNHSRSLFEQRQAMVSWAAQEKADIDSGAKKPPTTSLETFMADNKDLAKMKSSKNLSFEGKVSRVKSDLREDAEAVARSKKDLGEKDWSVRASDPKERYIPTKDQATGLRMQADLRRQSRAVAEGRIGDSSPMPKNDSKLKTGLVREVEPGRSRLAEAAKRREFRNQAHSQGAKVMRPLWAADAKMSQLQSAAETGEAQAFVGKMKPGVETRTQQHHLQSREFVHPPKAQGKDLGRAVVNTVRREAGLEGSGSLAKMAKERAKAGRSVAGPDPVKVPKNRSILKRGKPAGAMPNYLDAPEYKKGKGDENYFPKKLTID